MLKVLIISLALAFIMATAVQALDFHPFFKGEKIAAITIKNNAETKLDEATITTKSGKCYQLQMNGGKITAWKSCADVEWKKGDN